jgi:uncharacterized membrane protein YfhO
MDARTPYAGERIASYHSDSLAFDIPFIWRNEGIYIAKPAWDGYNSFIFSKYNALDESGKLLEYKEKPLIFSASGDSALVINSWDLKHNKISFRVDLTSADSLVLLQTWVPMWRAYVDGKQVEVHVFNDSFPAINIAKGEHLVMFEYRPTKTIYAGVLSLSVFVMLLTLAARSRRN